MNKYERQLLNPDLLRSFVAIAEYGNLTVAAAQLYRTQSAISVQLRKLEEELGVSLFQRSNKGMVLSEAGEKLLPKAQNILTELAATSALFSEPLSGRLRIGVPDDLEGSVLETVLMRFSRQHQGVNVRATCGCTSKFPDAIKSGALDVAVYSAPGNELGRHLFECRNIWAASSQHVPDRDAPVPLAILERDCWWQDAPKTALDVIERPYEIVFRSSSFAGVKSAIKSGLAIGILPDNSLEGDVIELGPDLGFPLVPKTNRSILISEAADPALTEAMADAIQAACHQFK
ncbi:MAG: LysR family transcriptional regulator [Pseudomonadota bacterium]